MKRISFTFGALAALLVACGGKVEVVPASSGAGGSGLGGHGGASATTTGGTTSGPQTSNASSSGDVGSSVGEGPGPSSSVASTGTGACVPCSQALQNGDTNLCPDSQKLYDAIVACICNVACPMECAGPCQMKGAIDAPCNDCINHSVQGPNAPCEAALEACTNDG